MKPLHTPVRFALVGCGRIARVHVERLHADGRADVVALTDRDRPSAERLKDELLPRADVFDGLDAILDADVADAAIICTPTHCHFEQAMSCLRKGLPVLCEKPLADTRERIVELVAQAQQSGLQFAVAYQRRHSDIYRTLRREVQSGRWGEVCAVTSHNYEDWQQWISGSWRDDPQLNIGGFVGDAGSHKIDTVFYVTGLQPVEVFARTRSCGSRVEIVATVSALLEGDVPLSIDFVGHAQNLGEDLYVHCARADLMIRDRRLWIGRKGSVELLADLERDTNPNASFVDLLLGCADNLAPPECALPVFDFTQAILESSHSGKSVVMRAAP